MTAPEGDRDAQRPEADPEHEGREGEHDGVEGSPDERDRDGAQGEGVDLAEGHGWRAPKFVELVLREGEGREDVPVEQRVRLRDDGEVGADGGEDGEDDVLHDAAALEEHLRDELLVGERSWLRAGAEFGGRGWGVGVEA